MDWIAKFYDFLLGSPHHANIKDLQLGMVAGPNTFHMDDQKPSQILETEAWHGPAIEIVETDITATAGNLDVAMPNDNGNGGIDFDKTHFFDNEQNLLYTASDGPGIN